MNITNIHDLSYFTSNVIINELLTNDVTFQQDVTVNGSLTVDGTTITANTDSYSTENLELTSTATTGNEVAILKINEGRSSVTANIIEVIKGSDEIFKINNSGDVTTLGSINGASSDEISKLAGIGQDTIIAQLNAKQDTIAGAATTITSVDLTANRVLYSDDLGKIRASSATITETELNYLDGVSGNIQTQLDTKQGILSYTTDVTVKDLTTSNVTIRGNVTATGNITAYYSDERLKTKISDIVDPLGKIDKLNGFYYKPNELAHSLGVQHTDVEIGLSAQDVQKVLPEIIRLSPLDCDYKNNEQISKSGENYLTLSYERIVPLLVESIKDLNKNNKLLSEDISSIKQKIDLN